MRIKGLAFLLLSVSGCVIDPHYEDKVLPYGDDVALRRDARYVGHTVAEMTFDASVVVLNSFYEGFDNDYLIKEYFHVSGHEGAYTIESFEKFVLDGPATPSSILLLTDQSGTYENVDPYNARFQAINKFLQDIVYPNTFLVASSSRDGALASEPLESPSAVFGNDWQGTREYLFDLSHRTGGRNSILDAASVAIDLFLQKTDAVRRELVLLVHANDESSAVSPEALIAKAKTHSVVVHVIALGTEPDPEVFSRLAQETGGIFAPCSRDKQMVKVFGELERLINGNLSVYKMRIRFAPSQGGVGPGSNWLHQIEIRDPYSDEIYNPVPVNLMIPL